MKTLRSKIYEGFIRILKFKPEFGIIFIFKIKFNKLLEEF